jgi:hypothetical protein
MLAAPFTGIRYGDLSRFLVEDVNLGASMIYVTIETKSGK